MDFRISPEYGESILLAVSGGVDSIVMAELFDRARKADFRPLRLCLAHCNFHLRGEESDGDEESVREWAGNHGVELFTADFDTRAFASEHGVSIEMAARELRYRWFDVLCSEHGFKGVCVAHNANDNAETLILNLLRGTGLKGLCGLREQSRNPYGNSLVFRPMLEYSRDWIQHYAADHSISYRTDSTNLENDCKRNLIRNEIFPLFASVNPSFLRTLNRDAEHLSMAGEIVRAYMREYLPETFLEACESPSAPFFMDREELHTLKFRRYFLHVLLQGYGFTAATVGDFCDMLDAGYKAGHIFYSDSYVMITASAGVKIISRSEYEGEIGTDGVSVELVAWNPSMSPIPPEGVLYLDASRTGGEPVIRKWEAGDWLRPLGMKGKKKVSDLLTDLKYDLTRKNGVLIAGREGDSHVLAVVGLRIDESVKITSSTSEAYRISKV